MSDDFQPFQTWLGLAPEITNPNFYELLGITPEVTDKNAIKLSADSLVSKLESIVAGEHEPTRIRLLAQVNQARNCLIDDEQRRGYDTRLKAAARMQENGNAQASHKNRSLSEKKTSSENVQVEHSSTGESAWPPGFEPPSADDLPEKVSSGVATETELPTPIVPPTPITPPTAPNPAEANIVPANAPANPATNPVATNSAATNLTNPVHSPADLAPAPVTPATSPDPSIPVVSAPVEDDLPEPVLPTKIHTPEPSPPDDSLPPTVSAPVSPPPTPSVEQSNPTPNPANPATNEPAAVPSNPVDGGTAIPVARAIDELPEKAVPLPAQVEPAPPVTAQPVTAQAVTPQPDTPQPVSEQPLPEQAIPAEQSLNQQPIPMEPVELEPVNHQQDLPTPIQPAGLTPEVNPASVPSAAPDQLNVSQPITAQPADVSQPSVPSIAAHQVPVPTNVPVAGGVGETAVKPAGIGGGAENAADRYRKLRRRSQMMTVIGVFLCVGLIGGGGFFAYKFRDSWMPKPEPSNSTEDSSVARIDPSEISKTGTTDSEDKNKDDVKSDSKKSLLVPIDPKEEDTSDTKKEADSDSENKTDMKKDEPDESETPEDPKMATDDPPTPEEKAEQLKEVTTLGKKLVSAKRALFDRELVKAKQLISEAEPLAKLLEHQDAVMRMKSVTEQIEIFWKTVMDECDKLQSLDEIPMATSIIVVVESSAEKLVYRYNGERTEVRPIEMPLGLAMKIAERTWNPPTAESRITRGSVYAIDSMERPANGEKARDIFEEAALVGGEVQPFLDFLEDDYDLVSALIDQEEIPDKKEVEMASEKLKEEYRKQFGASEKVELTRKILDDAPGLPDSASRMAAFELAADLAVLTGEIPLLVEALDTQAKWFKTDSDEVKATRIEDAARRRMSVDQSKELVRTAFELVEEAREANNLELAARYAKVAVGAAAKSRDADLRKAAGELNSQIREELKN